MDAAFEPALVLTVIVYGVVTFVALRSSFQAIGKAIRNWYRRKSAEIDAGIKQVLDHKDPEIEARMAKQERKCS